MSERQLAQTRSEPSSPSVSLRIVILAVVLALLLVSAPLVLSTSHLGLAAEALIFGLAAASLDLLVGYAGMPSLGHAAFVGIGSYAAGLSAIHWSGNALMGLVVGCLFGILFAALTGPFLVRTRGIYFLMLTLAFAEIAVGLAFTWQSLTGGSDGLAGIPSASLFGAAIRSPVSRYAYVAVVVCVGLAILFVVSNSPFGKALRGIRQNEDRMRSLGYSVERFQFIAYMLAGAVAAVAGGLHGQYIRFVSPSALSFESSVFLLLMPLIGGVGRLWGGVLGAFVVVFLRQELGARFGTWEIGLGLLLLVVAYSGPELLARLGKRVGTRVLDVIQE